MIRFIITACVWATACVASAQPAEYRIAADSAAGLRELLRYSGDPLPLVSGHRGGAGVGLPENCLATFSQTLEHGFAMLEVDPRVTRDGVVVLMHDATLDRTTTGSGPVAAHTLEQLKHLRLKDVHGTVTEHGIPTLSETFAWAKGRTVLVIDSKDLSVAQRVAQIEQHDAEAYAMIIAGSVRAAQECYQLNPEVMMEVMIPDRARLQDFEACGVPWENVVAFVGHEPTQDRGLIELLHARGVLVMAGTSRNLDRELAQQPGSQPDMLPQYSALLERGIDILETDLPRQVWPMLFRDTPIPAAAGALRPAPQGR